MSVHDKTEATQAFKKISELSKQTLGKEAEREGLQNHTPKEINL